jgi:transposase
VQGPSGRPTKEIRTFGTMTDELLALADWLEASGVTHVAMESTGVYWKPLVRHEALFDREGMKGTPPADRRSGLLKLRAA